MATILIIQSKDVVRALYRELLERAGHEVGEASQGLKGIWQYRQSPTDLVITDIHMSDCDGMEVILALGQEYPQVKILAVSAQVTNEDALITAKLFGADAILQDALDGEELMKIVNKLVGGP
jgi:two-component system chemotaxis response regulator CheY